MNNQSLVHRRSIYVCYMFRCIAVTLKLWHWMYKLDVICARIWGRFSLRFPLVISGYFITLLILSSKLNVIVVFSKAFFHSFQMLILYLRVSLLFLSWVFDCKEEVKPLLVKTTQKLKLSMSMLRYFLWVDIWGEKKCYRLRFTVNFFLLSSMP